MSIAKGEKVSFFDRVKKHYRGVTGELKKVHWPNRKELVSYTTVVLVSCLLVGAAIWIVDSGVSFLMGLILK